MKILKSLFVSILFTFPLATTSEEIKMKDKSTELNVYTGMFDFSDNGKRASLIGFQHQNENLNRDTFLGNLSPVTGAMITADNASYIYTGVQAQYKVGNINFTPSFTPGFRILIAFIIDS